MFYITCDLVLYGDCFTEICQKYWTDIAGPVLPVSIEIAVECKNPKLRQFLQHSMEHCATALVGTNAGQQVAAYRKRKSESHSLTTYSEKGPGGDESFARLCKLCKGKQDCEQVHQIHENLLFLHGLSEDSLLTSHKSTTQSYRDRRNRKSRYVPYDSSDSDSDEEAYMNCLRYAREQRRCITADRNKPRLPATSSNTLHYSRDRGTARSLAAGTPANSPMPNNETIGMTPLIEATANFSFDSTPVAEFSAIPSTSSWEPSSIPVQSDPPRPIEVRPLTWSPVHTSEDEMLDEYRDALLENNLMMESGRQQDTLTSAEMNSLQNERRSYLREMRKASRRASMLQQNQNTSSAFPIPGFDAPAPNNNNDLQVLSVQLGKRRVKTEVEEPLDKPVGILVSG